MLCLGSAGLRPGYPTTPHSHFSLQLPANAFFERELVKLISFSYARYAGKTKIAELNIFHKVSSVNCLSFDCLSLPISANPDTSIAVTSSHFC